MEASLTRAYRPLSKRLRVFAPPPCRALSSSRRPASHARATTVLPQPISSLGSSHAPRREWIGHYQGRNFSISSSRRSNTVVNPRNDEEGKEMKIEITPRASNRLHSIAEKDSNPNLCLRVAVESGGCHGFQYLMSLTSLDDISREEDSVFESEDGKGARVVMDEPSLELLKGSTIDYTMELIGSQFKVTGIPGAKSSCGCGTSFDIQA